MPDVYYLKEKVAASCRVLARAGCMRECTGHVSARIEGTDTILIRGRADNETGLLFTTSRDIVMIDLKGNLLEKGVDLRPPSETPLHTAIYSARPDVVSVVHGHPTYTAVMSAMDKPLMPVCGGYHFQATAMAADGIPVCERTVLIDNEERAQDMLKAMKGANVVLLKGHGLAAAGKSIESAASITIATEHLARMNFLANLLGKPRSVPQEELDDFVKPKPDGGKPWAARSVFRFYEDLINQRIEKEI